jgi:hypothetical protein
VGGILTLYGEISGIDRRVDSGVALLNNPHSIRSTAFALRRDYLIAISGIIAPQTTIK